MQIWLLILAGICVHLILFYSIFDIYFTSPLVHGMTPIIPPGNAPAERLVLIVIDGARADRVFELDKAGQPRVPYLRNIIKHEGVWGVSHTRVPTESRPGHVALIAGFYEDVSAVAKGWKENPVEFDSAFNESRYTWSWGSPDVLPMFAKGATGDHVKANFYSAHLEHFAGSDMTKQDSWVFQKVEKFFEKASSINSTVKEKVQKNKIIFFLHLLGLDTYGHSRKPHSKMYFDYLKLVDKGIKHIVSVIENFYANDGKTVFIVTSDHGMTDWGSHGAGHSHETLTPLIAWGAGVRKPIEDSHCGIDTDSFCKDWYLQKVKRVDVNQADVAPLMASLLGIAFPVNSVGCLPTDVLSLDDKVKAELLLANAEQILSQFQVKMEQVKKRTLSFTFRPFRELIDAEKIQALKHIRQLILSDRSSDAINESRILIDKALRGLRYYQTYDRLFLGVSVVLGFAGWMMYILFMIVQEHTDYNEAKLSQTAIVYLRQYIFASFGLLIVFLLYIQSLSLMCYLYCLMPVLLWYKSTKGLTPILLALKHIKDKGWMLELVFSLVFCIISLEILILSFYHRELLSVGLIVMSLWPICLLCFKSNSAYRITLSQIGWMVSCGLVAVFPFLPVVSKDTHINWLLASGILALLLGLLVLSRFPSGRVRWLYLFQLLIVFISIIVMYNVREVSLKTGFPLPLECQIFSWTVLGLSIFLPSFSPTTVKDRLFSLLLSFIAPYLLLSIAYEVFFFLSLSCLLFFWLKSEADEKYIKSHKNFEEFDFQLMKSNFSRPSLPQVLELSDLRRAVFFIFLIITAFFGTGNIASINSFNPTSVYCFLTVFKPFLMGTLMMIKIIFPFLLVTCAIQAVHVVSGTSLRSLFLIVLIMSDFMGMHFFFLVKDYGSWLEIGTTISHYVIVMSIIIFLFLLIGFSHAITRWSWSIFKKRSTF